MWRAFFRWITEEILEVPENDSIRRGDGGDDHSYAHEYAVHTPARVSHDEIDKIRAVQALKIEQQRTTQRQCTRGVKRQKESAVSSMRVLDVI